VKGGVLSSPWGELFNFYMKMINGELRNSTNL